MPYVIGVALSVGVASFARRVGFDRDRAFYPTVLMVIASYYVLFAATSGSVRTALLEQPCLDSPTSAPTRVIDASGRRLDWHSPAGAS
jgi:hypothetical protein